MRVLELVAGVLVRVVELDLVVGVSGRVLDLDLKTSLVLVRFHKGHIVSYHHKHSLFLILSL